MKTTSVIVSALLAITHSGWLINAAHAEPGEYGKHDRNPGHRAQEQRQTQREEHSGPSRNGLGPKSNAEQNREDMHRPTYSGPVQVGGYFQPHQREAAREYFGRSENRGFCPPGLAKKGNGCMPPGQARKWRAGYPLPSGLVYYEVPRSVVLTLGIPPQGYRYVRVASDILLIAVGTSMVVDAIEDLVR
jgi:Ni/Co efflux regulator RcnB